jgi:hypothetical protein
MLDWLIEKFPIFRKDKESMANVGKLLQIYPEVVEIK